MYYYLAMDYCIMGNFGGKKFGKLTLFDHWQTNRSAKRLSIVSTDLDCFSLAKNGWLYKLPLAKLFRHMVYVISVLPCTKQPIAMYIQRDCTHHTLNTTLVTSFKTRPLFSLKYTVLDSHSLGTTKKSLPYNFRGLCPRLLLLTTSYLLYMFKSINKYSWPM